MIARFGIEVSLTGTPLDTKDWTFRKPLQIARAGVQELELDLDALAKSGNDYADLRLLLAGNQIPYVLEQPALPDAIIAS